MVGVETLHIEGDECVLEWPLLYQWLWFNKQGRPILADPHHPLCEFRLLL